MGALTINSLLLIAHGSRRAQSNEEVFVLADKLRQACSEQYQIVHAGFLEMHETLIPDGVKNCVDDGATSVTVLPYFLNSGRHVVEDVPNIVSDCRLQYPNVDIRIAPHLGASPMMVDLLISVAS
ncbi:MAG: sirohydrochlorin ferrochelatase [Candidatus Azotimanducaceae bacterium]|jgi:sirohydrochlorin ferrochelatase